MIMATAAPAVSSTCRTTFLPIRTTAAATAETSATTAAAAAQNVAYDVKDRHDDLGKKNGTSFKRCLI
jgi:hypothetical protein